MKLRLGSGELRSLSADDGGVRDGEDVLATPKEKSGDGRGPGMVDAAMREDENAYK